MSIHGRLAVAVSNGLLIEFEPVITQESTKRSLFATPEVHRLVIGPWNDEAEEKRCGKLMADFERFVLGRHISVNWDKHSKNAMDSFMARLHPYEHEVWQIRSRVPSPGIRIFGRFAYRDCFIAFSWRYRRELNGKNSPEYLEVMRSCQAQWSNIFASYDAFTGDRIDDYISKKYIPC